MIGGSSLKKIDLVKIICTGGMLTALTVLFQAAPVFLPAIGLALSPLSTLPIAIAAVCNVLLGLFVIFSSALILTMVSVQETIILLFTTGLLGIVIGALLYRKGIIYSIILSSIALFFGITFLTYIVGIPVFIDLTRSLSILITFLLFLLFSLVYATFWNIGLRKIMTFLNYAKIIN